MDEYKGREVRTTIRATVDEKGWWTFFQTISQYRTKDLKEWEDRSISAQAVAETLEKAQSQCVLTVMTYLESVQGDLFNAQELETNNEKVN